MMTQKQRTIYEIQKGIKRDECLLKVSLLLMGIFFLLTLLIASQWFKPYEPSFFLFWVVIPILLIIISSIVPSTSSLERVRYFLDDTIRKVSAQDMTGANISFDKMMDNFDDLINEFKELPYLPPIKKRLKKIFDGLKYRIYPILEEERKEEFELVEAALRNFADLLTKEDSSELDKYIGHIVQHFKKRDEVVLPYEKPFLLSKLFNVIRDWISSNFEKSVAFRIFSFSFVLLGSYCFVIRFTNLEFSEEMVAALIVVSGVAAAGAKQVT